MAQTAVLPARRTVEHAGDGQAAKRHFLNLRFFESWNPARIGKWIYELDQMGVIGRGDAYGTEMRCLMSVAVQEAMQAECDVRYADLNFGGLTLLHDRPIYKFDGGDCRECTDREKRLDPEKDSDYVSETVEGIRGLRKANGLLGSGTGSRHATCKK